MSRQKLLELGRFGKLLWRKPAAVRELALPSVYVSTDSESSPRQLLDFSTILLQDGSDIHDLPLLIRRTGPNDFPFVSMTSAADTIRQASQEDAIFSQRLSSCKSVYDILDLLEVPEDDFSAASAAFALYRLCQLSVNLGDKLEHYVRQTLLTKLCESSLSGLQQLSNDSVINLAECSLSLSNFNDKLTYSVNMEIERRISDGVFSIQELCRIVELLSSTAGSDLSLANKAWVHISSRIPDINKGNLALLFKMMKFTPPKYASFWRVLSNRFQECWWQLGSAHIATVMESLAFNNNYQWQILSSTCNWLFMNIHEVSDTELMPIIGTFTHFEFSNAKLIRSLERYMKLKVGRCNKTLVAMVMDHCRQQRHLSPVIFEAVAADFEKNGHMYEPHEIHLALRPFGQLNYMPPNSYRFFSTVDTVLFKRFTEFDSLKMLELVASFMYLEKFAINFISKIQIASSVSRLLAITDVARRQRFIEYYLQLQVATLIEIPHLYLHHLMDRLDLKLAFSWNARYAEFHRELGASLFRLLSPQCTQVTATPGRSPYVIDFELLVTAEGKLVPFCIQNSFKFNTTTTKLAILIVMPEYYCSNKKHLLGEYVTKRRHLEKMSYQVIPVEYEMFHNQLKEKKQRLDYLRSQLTPYITFTDGVPKTVPVHPRRQHTALADSQRKSPITPYIPR